MIPGGFLSAPLHLRVFAFPASVTSLVRRILRIQRRMYVVSNCLRQTISQFATAIMAIEYTRAKYGTHTNLASFLERPSRTSHHQYNIWKSGLDSGASSTVSLGYAAGGGRSQLTKLVSLCATAHERQATFGTIPRHRRWQNRTSDTSQRSPDSILARRQVQVKLPAVP